MAGKRRTAAEMAAAREAAAAEFGRGLVVWRQSHPPEECSCAEKDANGICNPMIFDARYLQQAAKAWARDAANAKKAGCTEYIWRSAGDGDTCPRCAANEGKTFRYDKPPAGGHPGLAPGCRCYGEAVIPGLKRRLPSPAHTPVAGKRMSRFAKILWIAIGLVVLALIGGGRQ